MNVMTPEFLSDIAAAAKRIGEDDKVKSEG